MCLVLIKWKKVILGLKNYNFAFNILYLPYQLVSVPAQYKHFNQHAS